MQCAWRDRERDREIGRRERHWRLADISRSGEQAGKQERLARVMRVREIRRDKAGPSTQKSQSEEHRLGGKEAGEIMIAHGGSVVC